MHRNARIDEALAREQYRSLTRLMPVMYAVILGVTGLLVVGFHQTAPTWVITYGPGALSIIVLARTVHWVRARASVDDMPLAIIHKELRAVHVVGPVLSVAFALMGAHLMNHADPVQQSLALIAIWVVAVASGFCLYAVRGAAIGVVLAAAGPMSLYFLFSGHTIVMQLALVFAAVSGLVIWMLTQVNRGFCEIVLSRAALDEARKVAEAERERATLLAETDALTGLANRRRVDKHLAELSRSATRYASLMVAMIDLDGFKPVNDMHGHKTGDAILRQVGLRLTAAIGGEGLVARMGGDEFAVIAEGYGEPERALALARRIRDAFAAPFVHDAIEAHLDASVGLALRQGEGGDFERLLERADIALYHAKATHRGGAAIFTDALESEALERATLEHQLRLAIAQDALEVDFQPIVRLADGALIGFEALARWRHPTLGAISPAMFIPLAEQTGLIEAATDGLLRKAARMAAGWPPELLLSFNLSGAHLSRQTAGLKVLAALGEAGLSPRRLMVEVTETAVMRDIAAARAALQGLKDAGARIALDDFGAGYSSFAHLRDLPLDRLKIDKSFVDAIVFDRRAENLVRGILSMASSLDLDCVAEGVESAEQLALLSAMDCAAAQGFHLAHPVHADDVGALIAQWSGGLRKAG